MKGEKRYAGNVVSTTYEGKSDIEDVTAENASALRTLGSRVLHSIDATRINETFSGEFFKLIVFQFPNVGSRSPIYGRNPNHVLVRRFLKASRSILTWNGKVAISVVNTPFYDGAFDMDGAAEAANFQPPITYPFLPNSYPEYSHVNTLDINDSAIGDYDKFITFVFSPR